jgi:hypothetical protein
MHGGFSGEWYYDPKSFYNNDGMSGRPSWMRVMNFYWHQPGKIFLLPAAKLKLAFGNSVMLFLLFFVLWWYWVIQRIYKKGRIAKGSAILLIILSNALFAMALLIDPPAWLWLGLSLAMATAWLAVKLFKQKQEAVLPLPLHLWLVFFSLFLFVILGSGLKRHAEIIDFFFGLCAIYALINFNTSLPKASCCENVKTKPN